MIQDFPPFLLSNIWLIICIPLLAIQMCLALYIAEKCVIKRNLVDRLPKISESMLALVTATNAVFMLVSFPVSDVGANCWANCFHFVNIGLAGYIANYLSCLLVAAMIMIVVDPRFRSRATLLSLTFLYGISMFVHMGFLDKGLWCIVRSSGYMYLWNSFALILIVGWVTYFATVVVIYMKAFENPD